MTILRGESAADFMFGPEWRKLNARTEAADEERAQRYKVPCLQPGCSGKFCCVTVEIHGVDTAVCRACADKVFAAAVPEEV